MFRICKILLIVCALLAAATGSVAQAVPAFEITLSGPTNFIPDQPLSGPFTGALTAASVGVPGQTIEISVDGLVVSTAATTLQGSYAVILPPFTGTADRTVRATAFGGTPLETSAEMVVEVVRYPLTVTRAGTGSGTVISSPVGIACPGRCSSTFPATTVVQLNANPAFNSFFAGWSGGGCFGTGTCTVSMSAATTVTATFMVNQFMLSVMRAGGGTGTVTSTPAGISCGSDCSELYNAGTMVTLTASPAFNSLFAGWSGGGCFGTGTCTVSMNAATTVTATFNPAVYILNVSKAGGGSGTVTSTPAGINCGGDCSELYNAGTMVTLTATASSLFGSFYGWSGAGCSGTGTCTVTMNAAQFVTAFFS